MTGQAKFTTRRRTAWPDAFGARAALGWLLGGRDGRLLLAAVGAVLDAPLAALAAVTATSALSLGLRVVFLRRLSGA